MSKNNAIGEALFNGDIDSNSYIKVFVGPPGGYGFRSGWWSVEVGGFAFLVFASIPHNIPLQDQYDILRGQIRDFLTGKRRTLQSR